MVKTRFRLYSKMLSNATLVSAALVIAFLPLTISPIVNAECTPPPETTPGVHHPVGSDAAAFTYNCDTGLWESDYYTFDPVKAEYQQKDPTVYTYNPSTGAYDYVIWMFSAPLGHYVALEKSTGDPPANGVVVGRPIPVAANSISTTGPNSNNTVNNNGGGGSSISNTGPNSNNTANGTGTNNTTGNNTTNLNVTNQLTAAANSGDALIVSNTKAGGAQSGDVQDITNIMNLLQSASNSLGDDTVTFVANIDGDVNGDLMFDPAAMGSIQPAAKGGNNNLTLNNSVNASINNNIDLTAKSGDAEVSNNTEAGDAKSGSAKIIANIVNIINSAVTSGKSFFGVININGNLNGDILLPPDLVDQLIAANVPTVDIIADTGPNSNNTINDPSSNNTTVTNTNNHGITNNVNSTAKSGNATVSENTSAGSATSGKAATHLTAFNLTGSQVIGRNAILVFVNVVGGQWVGMIVNAPPGATAAALGGGLKTNSSGNNNTAVNNTSNQTINNNIKTTAQSGDAGVTRNTKGGSATSGDADTAVNLLNVENSSLSLSDWFGVLFINVFGTWNGSFGINTSAGDPASKPAFASGSPSTFAAASAFMDFNPATSGDTSTTGAGNGSATSAANVSGGNTISNTGPNSTNSILAAVKNQGSKPTAPTPGHVNWLIIVASSGLFVLAVAGEQVYTLRQNRNKATSPV